MRYSLLLVLTAATCLPLASCLRPVGYNGVDAASLRLKQTSAVSEREAAQISRRGDLFLFMERKYCKDLEERGRLFRDYGVIDLDGTDEMKIRSLMCFSSYGQRRNSNSYVSQLHRRIDDRRMRPLDAAIALVLCTGEKLCSRRAATGQLGWYGQAVDRAAVREAVEMLNIPDEMRLAFLRRADAAAELIAARVEQLNPEVRAFVRDTVFDVRARRRAHWQTYAPLWKRFDSVSSRARTAVRKKSVDRAIIKEVESLRAEYVQACRKAGSPLEDCLFGQLGAPLTEHLIRLAIAIGDPVLAKAENSLLLARGVRSSAAAEIMAAQSEAYQAWRTRRDKIAAARRSGVDETTIRNQYGNVGKTTLYKSWIWDARVKRRDYAKLIAEIGAAKAVRGTIESVKTKGKLAVISMAYKDSVTVAAPEALELKPGQSILVVRAAEGEIGLVVVVSEGRSLVGARGLR